MTADDRHVVQGAVARESSVGITICIRELEGGRCHARHTVACCQLACVEVCTCPSLLQRVAPSGDRFNSSLPIFAPYM